MDRDRVGDDREERRDGAFGAERREKSAVKGVGADDGARLVLADKVVEGFLKGGVEEVGLLADVALGKFLVGPFPDTGEIDNRDLVCGLQKLGQEWQALFEEVYDEDGFSGGCQLFLQCLGNRAGGRVMTVSEACRQNQNHVFCSMASVGWKTNEKTLVIGR